MAKGKQYSVTTIQKHLSTFRTVLPEGDATMFCNWLVEGASVAQINRPGPRGPVMVKTSQVIEWAAANGVTVNWEPEAGRLVFQAKDRPAEKPCTGCQNPGQADAGYYVGFKGAYGAIVNVHGELQNPDAVEACDTCGVFEGDGDAVEALEEHLRGLRRAGAFE